MRRLQSVFFAMLLIAGGIACRNGSTSKLNSSNDTNPDSTIVNPAAQESAPKESASTESAPSHAKRRAISPVEIGGSQTSVGSVAGSNEEQLLSIRAALKPFQILLGRWNGLSRKAVTDHPEHPGLWMLSETSGYVRNGRLTYLPSVDQFEFSAVDPEGIQRTFRGTFSEPVRDVAGDEKKLQRTFKLQLTEPQANASGEQWRITLNQQENNRYILEVDRKRGSSPFTRVDTVHTQREGTSFALSESDYGEKTCIISQGLGTISVSYQGQTFWVCCSGCKAAFEDDPAKWIAKWEERKNRMLK